MILLTPPITVLLLALLFSSGYFCYLTFFQKMTAHILRLVMMGLGLIYFIDIAQDLFSLLNRASKLKAGGYLEQALWAYLKSSWEIHFFLLAYFICFTIGMQYLTLRKAPLIKARSNQDIVFKNVCLIALSSLPLISVEGLEVWLYLRSNEPCFNGSRFLPYLIGFYLSVQLFILIKATIRYQKTKDLKYKLIDVLGKAHSLVTAFLGIILIMPAFIESKKLGLSYLHLPYFFVGQKKILVAFLLMLLFLIILICCKKRMKKAHFLSQTGQFGSAEFATRQDLKKAGLYNEEAGILSGQDESKQNIYLPLKNKLTISPQGGGKTSASSINALLTHLGNLFVFDIKGELWATTARYRMENLGQQVISIDPYGLTRGKDFIKKKPTELLTKYHLNPFDWIPEDQGLRDRMINAFAASFIINEGGSAQHFDDNAKILIRGYIDYMMQSFSQERRNLNTLYQLLSEHQDQAIETFKQMSGLDGRAQAAANQISRVGSDEKGSILSTTYRQIDWMSDYNVKATLSHSNFDLRKFITGKMDIYVILPEDQIKEHQRFVRMLLSLIMSFIVQADPSSLPKNKMLFLLDELAQLGYCPDVEQAIEVLRARKLVVWTVFQTLSQIKMYKKPDLFIGAPIKQIFTNDDVETMQWIQTLGGKRTVITHTLSNNEGDSKQKMQWLGGSISKGEGESTQETGVDLIHLNEIRELKEDEQFIFMHGLRPIKCKKVRYFEHPFFKGKYDVNPVEIASS